MYFAALIVQPFTVFLHKYIILLPETHTKHVTNPTLLQELCTLPRFNISRKMSVICCVTDDEAKNMYNTL